MSGQVDSTPAKDPRPDSDAGLPLSGHRWSFFAESRRTHPHRLEHETRILRLIAVLLVGLVGAGIVKAASTAVVKDTRCFDLRTSTAAPGKLDALHARFRDHTNAVFHKHGMTVIGYWEATER